MSFAVRRDDHRLIADHKIEGNSDRNARRFHGSEEIVCGSLFAKRLVLFVFLVFLRHDFFLSASAKKLADTVDFVLFRSYRNSL